MEEVEIAWAAGLWDGEGCTALNHSRLTCFMSQKGDPPVVLERFMYAVDVGIIYGPYKKPDVFHFHAYGKDAQALLRLLWPYLSEPKREQAIYRGFNILA